MKLETAIEIALNEEIYDDFIVEEWEDGELLNDYKVIKRSGLGSKRRSPFGNDGTFYDTWVVAANGKYYPAKIVRNSITNQVKVRVYKRDGTKNQNEAFKKCIAYHREIDDR